MRRKIEVVPYDVQWPAVFEMLRARVWSAVGGVAVGIEHVGSTSVPDLAAKPIVDIDVICKAEDVAAAIERLGGIGYTHQGDLGINGREAFRAPVGAPAHNLYVCPEGAMALRNHLALRDYLRQHPVAARLYGKLKVELAKQFPEDIDSYVAGKTEFILRILASRGFTNEEMSSIRGQNAPPHASAEE